MSTASELRRIEDLFHRTRELPAGQRHSFLEAETGGDAALVDEVLTLLELDQLDDGFLEQAAPPTKDMALADKATAKPESFGEFRLVRLLGQGGMGSVFEAWQENPARAIALKLIRPDFLSPDAVRRFERETYILGQLQHPGIARIYQAGVAETPSGRQPWFAMELIRGQTLSEFVSVHQPSRRQRIELLARLCDAVHHAHSRGVVHRDLKPANILVELESDGPTSGPTPKILDFGIARVMDTDLERATLQTSAGQIVGTVPYMSPEQIRGDQVKVGPLSDIYSLGVILFELLAGRLPFDVSRCALAEAARIIQEDEPARLSSADSRMRGDLETIVAKAMAKEPMRRYASAADLAADLRRFLQDEPIVARPATTWYRLGKFARRHRALVAATAGILVTLIAALVSVSYLAMRESRQRQLAEEVTRQARVLSYRSSLAAAFAAMEAGDYRAARNALNDAPADLRGWEWQFVDAAIEHGHAELPAIGASVDAFCVSGDRKMAAVSSARSTVTLYQLPRLQPLQSIDAGVETQSAIALDRDGRHLLVSDRRNVRCFSVASGRQLWTFPASFRKSVLFGGCSPDGDVVALAHPVRHAVSLVELETGKLIRELTSPKPTTALAFSPCGTALAVEATDTLWWLDLPTGQWRELGLGSFPSFLKGANQLWCGHVWGLELRSYRLDTLDLAFVERTQSNHFQAPLASFDHRNLVVNTWKKLEYRDGRSGALLGQMVAPDRTAFVVDIAEGRLFVELNGRARLYPAYPSDFPVVVDVSHFKFGGVRNRADGCAAAARFWGTVLALEPTTGLPKWSQTWTRHGITDVALHPTEPFLVAADTSGRLAKLAWSDGQLLSEQIMASRANVLRWSPDGQRLAVVADSTLEVRDQTLALQNRWSNGQLGVHAAAFIDSRRLLCWSNPENSPSAVWIVSETRSGLEGRQLQDIPAPHQAVVGPDGQIALLDAGGLFTILNSDGQVVRQFAGVAEARAAIWPGDVSRLFVQAGGELHIFCPRQGVLLAVFPLPGVGFELGFDEKSKALTCLTNTNRLTIFDPTISAERSLDRLVAREAHAHIQDATTQLLAVKEAAQRLESAADSATNAGRAAAVSYFQRSVDDINLLNSDAWGVVREPGGSEEAYRAAHRRISIVLTNQPDNYGYLNTLAFAEYRLNQFEKALAIADRCISMYEPRFGEGIATDHALRAMCLARLGRLNEAQSTIALAVGALARFEKEASGVDPWTTSLVNEAAQLVDLLSKSKGASQPASTSAGP